MATPLQLHMLMPVVGQHMAAHTTPSPGSTDALACLQQALQLVTGSHLLYQPKAITVLSASALMNAPPPPAPGASSPAQASEAVNAVVRVNKCANALITFVHANACDGCLHMVQLTALLTATAAAAA